MQENFTTLDKYLAYIWVDTRPMDTISFPDDEVTGYLYFSYIMCVFKLV